MATDLRVESHSPKIFLNTYKKGKGNSTGHEGSEEWSYSSILSLTSALDGVGGQRHAPVALPAGMTRYQFYRRLGGPRDRSGLERKISSPPGFDPHTVQPVASRYTDRAIAPVVKHIFKYKSYTIDHSKMATGCLRRGIKRPGHGVDHPPPLGAEVKESIELYFYTTIWVFMACYRMKFAVTQRSSPYVFILNLLLSGHTVNCFHFTHINVFVMCVDSFGYECVQAEYIKDSTSTLSEEMNLFTNHPIVSDVSNASRKQITIHNIRPINI